MKTEATDVTYTILGTSALICIICAMSAINSYAPFKGDPNWAGFYWSVGISVASAIVFYLAYSGHSFPKTSKK